jgi:hypothetical protein
LGGGGLTGLFGEGAVAVSMSVARCARCFLCREGWYSKSYGSGYRGHYNLCVCSRSTRVEMVHFHAWTELLYAA